MKGNLKQYSERPKVGTSEVGCGPKKYPKGSGGKGRNNMAPVKGTDK